MKKAKARFYDAHLDYDVRLDLDLLNTRIRIIDENFEQTGKVFFEGTAGRFIRERVPSDFLVELLAELSYNDRISYRLSNVENYIEKL